MTSKSELKAALALGFRDPGQLFAAQEPPIRSVVEVLSPLGHLEARTEARAATKLIRGATGLTNSEDAWTPVGETLISRRVPEGCIARSDWCAHAEGRPHAHFCLLQTFSGGRHVLTVAHNDALYPAEAGAPPAHASSVFDLLGWDASRVGLLCPPPEGFSLGDVRIWGCPFRAPRGPEEIAQLGEVAGLEGLAGEPRRPWVYHGKSMVVPVLHLHENFTANRWACVKSPTERCHGRLADLLGTVDWHPGTRTGIYPYVVGPLPADESNTR